MKHGEATTRCSRRIFILPSPCHPYAGPNTRQGEMMERVATAPMWMEYRQAGWILWGLGKRGVIKARTILVLSSSFLTFSQGRELSHSRHDDRGGKPEIVVFTETDRERALDVRA